jgi:L-ascorbate oxidase
MAGPLPVLRAPGVLGAADMGHGGMDPAKMDHSKMDHAAMGHDTSGLVHVPPVDAPVGTKVLAYADLKRLDRGYASSPPARTIEIRLTGNMDRYYWSFDDRKYSEQPTIDFTEGETVRLVFRNETMMNHPLHLHGLWMDLDNGAGEARPRKHVVIVPPGRTVSVTVHMAAVGRWPFHCHLMFHMMTGMFREFVVHPKGDTLPAASSAPMTGGGHAHH